MIKVMNEKDRKVGSEGVGVKLVASEGGVSVKAPMMLNMVDSMNFPRPKARDEVAKAWS